MSAPVYPWEWKFWFVVAVLCDVLTFTGLGFNAGMATTGAFVVGYGVGELRVRAFWDNQPRRDEGGTE